MCPFWNSCDFLERRRPLATIQRQVEMSLSISLDSDGSGVRPFSLLDSGCYALSQWCGALKTDVMSCRHRSSLANQRAPNLMGVVLTTPWRFQAAHSGGLPRRNPNTTVDAFSEGSGLMLNRAKTLAILLNPEVFSPDWTWPVDIRLQPAEQHYRYLGIQVESICDAAVPSENGPYRSSGIRPRSGSPGEQLFEAEPRMGRRGVGPVN
ncbi:unnamed protein product [Phytophthora fragariaefolia]|uniref:Unnamed protein product n=1 Tax=Phytophthora fragariaefolia TaxID=1490495 RepID=A0A9W6XEP1_9STRA|nr:unnamed protein product [Phytophthora fragariaefolia]